MYDELGAKTFASCGTLAGRLAGWPSTEWANGLEGAASMRRESPLLGLLPSIEPPAQRRT